MLKPEIHCAPPLLGPSNPGPHLLGGALRKDPKHHTLINQLFANLLGGTL